MGIRQLLEVGVAGKYHIHAVSRQARHVQIKLSWMSASTCGLLKTP